MRYRRLVARNTSANIGGKRAQCTGDPPTLPVPVSCGTRSLTAPASGNMSATTPMKQSRPASESRRTSKLSMQTVGVLQGLRLGKQAAAAARFSPCLPTESEDVRHFPEEDFWPTEHPQTLARKGT